eukprot:595833_1
MASEHLPNPSYGPDKLGLLIQCRRKMDELSTQSLNNYLQIVISMLSTIQLRDVLFVGLNGMRCDIKYSQFGEMKSTINKLIQNKKKAKKKRNTIKTNALSPTWPIIVPKDASLTETIPFDIISNAICTEDARVLVDGYYEKSVDGEYKEWDRDIHRFTNVEQLSIQMKYLEQPQIFNAFSKVKHLVFYAPPIEWDGFDEFDINLIKVSPVLQSISFVGMVRDDTDVRRMVSMLLQLYNNHNTNTQIKQIAFIDCDFQYRCAWPIWGNRGLGIKETMEFYLKMTQFVLPSQPNQIQILKFENTHMGEIDHKYCKETKDNNIQFADIERTKASLCNLKGLVYGHTEPQTDVLFDLSKNILGNLASFRKLESVHTHDVDKQLISLCLTRTNTNALRNITELCLSTTIMQTATSPLRSLHQLVPKLEKLCLVFNISESDHENVQTFKKTFEAILLHQTELKVFQIVAVMDSYEEDECCEEVEFCKKRLVIVTKLMKQYIQVLDSVRSTSSDRSKRPLLFRFHVKSCHYSDNESSKCVLIAPDTSPWSSPKSFAHLVPFIEAIEDMIGSYLRTYLRGKIQFKLSFNADGHNILPIMKRYIKRYSIKESGKIISLKERSDCCYNEMNYKQLTISVTTKCRLQIIEKQSTKWKVDCRY